LEDEGQWVRETNRTILQPLRTKEATSEHPKKAERKSKAKNSKTTKLKPE